jgi:hypothetical protein
MKVKHELTIIAKCLVDETRDEYQCTVETECFIQVETILDAARQLSERKIYQEDLCVLLAKNLGGDAGVTLVGTHSGVKTTVSCYAYEAI